MPKRCRAEALRAGAARHAGLKRLGHLLLVSMLVASSTVSFAQQPEASTGFATRPAAHGHDAMVVTANAHATQAAVDILREGGTAVDAAIAAALVLNVVEPQSSGIGGGGFLLHYDASGGRIDAWDGREFAAAAATEELFHENGTPLAFFDAVVGGRSVGVPGLLRMFEAAHAQHGRLPWRRLFEHAIALAQHGFEVSPRLHALLERDPHLRDDPSARSLFYRADGRALGVGQRLANPELSATLRKLSTEGADALYRGEIARDIVAAVQAEPRPGPMTTEDLARYRPVRRNALCGDYRRHRVCGMPPPSSGGGTVLAMLGLLERFDLPSLDPQSAFVTHLFSEAGRLAYADRDAWYGDPTAMPVPVEALIGADYLAARSEQIALTRSMGRALAGRPRGAEAASSVSHERPSTSHLSIVDREGNAVALTASIENAFGSRRMVRGFLLNNQLTDFSFSPQRSDGSPHPNRVQGGLRPRSSMAPTLVFAPDGRLFAITGSPGGSAIIQYVAASIIGVVDWGLAPELVVARPHAGSRNGPTEVEDSPDGRRLAERLKLFGHSPVLRDFTSGVALIVRSGRGWTGAADPRREGTAATVSR